ncbi:UDP-3-O-[3-hydroxymyristoyl] N-acetylglucosamine deacetylase [Hartmannibacter diazotrophicus]|uniref:UDP-3-O-acyl-N-acetylglucosamine deacetylase n=1 Tax=Hartmannibacter diazotrophicus TaxID=1482074 RepID=A0A2C9D864_9HYPH|nr:UDP-3-O-acyl-N-acetylglucosamine deacetylase [Hartmannibacter diazotrophicus]SON56512.1 UDP-3-O-[3-hydroxymyristoyl] N-acetylglucosamine deacetylase [Hartmannibacter diazotrophicus]
MQLKKFGGYQTTLAREIRFDGVGVHAGKPASLLLRPASADRGIVFRRTDETGREVEIPARFDYVVATDLCTVLGVDGLSVATVEHLMAALLALGVDNVDIEVEGPEVPILDGCSVTFVDGIQEAGLTVLASPRKVLRILKTVRVEQGDAFAELSPFEGCRYDVTIDFTDPVIGRQSYVFDLSAHGFRTELARARTFGFMSDVEKLWKIGFALGSSLENSVAVGEGRVMNPEGLRFPDEFARHKTLDAVGDLALAGAPFVGRYRSYKGGHRMNVAVLKALFADHAAYEFVSKSAVRREAGSAVMVAGSGLAAAPDI